MKIIADYNKLTIKKSMIKTFSVFLVGIVLLVTFIASAIIYVSLFNRDYSRLEKKADLLIKSLDDILEIPLWNFDSLTVEKIGRSYVQDDAISLLRIRDADGTLYFDLDRGSGELRIVKEGIIQHKGQHIGSTEIALSTEALKRQNRSMLFSTLQIIIVIIIILIVFSGIFLRKSLKFLFLQIDEIAEAIVSDSYDEKLYRIPFREFQPLIDTLLDIREKLRVKISEIKEAEEKYRSIFNNAVEGIFQTSSDGKFLNLNPALALMLGYDSPEEVMSSVSDIKQQLYVNPGSRDKFMNLLLRDGRVEGYEIELYTKQGTTRWISLHSRTSLDDEGNISLIEGTAQDITVQKEQEEENRQLEQKLFQSQKMESIGRLAGGVAHDFNNMLSIIIGYSDMLLASLPEEEKAHGRVLQINKAARRSADLTRQLLTFARKQIVSPVTLNLNETISGMLEMLQRLLTENISLEMIQDKDLVAVEMDPAQIDQIMVNLCINAGHAIEGNGRIIIETKNIYLDEDYMKKYPDHMPGHYAMISVTDTGSGMEKEIVDKIFEPFFTTKGPGHGTGLGLATVYGIIQQNGGIISVYSEPGQGSCFKIYLPAVEGAVILDSDDSVEIEPISGDHTVLLVEDEEMLLQLENDILESFGFTVIKTASPLEAVKLAEAHRGKIEILVSDLVMPDLNGRELLEQIRAIVPDIICLLMSGYTDRYLDDDRAEKKEYAFIQKPFTKKALYLKMRDLLQSLEK